MLESGPLGEDLATDSTMADRSRLEPSQKNSIDDSLADNAFRKGGVEKDDMAVEEVGADKTVSAMETSFNEKDVGDHESRLTARKIPHLRAITPIRYGLRGWIKN